MSVTITKNGPGFMEATIDMSQPKQNVVRVGDRSLREPRLHTLGDQINYTEADPAMWGRELIILPVPTTDMFDVEVYEKTRIRLIPKTSLAASILSDWLGSEPKMAWLGVNAQHAGRDDTRSLEICFEPRAKPEPPAPAPAASQPKKSKKGRR